MIEEFKDPLHDFEACCQEHPAELYVMRRPVGERVKAEAQTSPLCRALYNLTSHLLVHLKRTNHRCIVCNNIVEEFPEVFCVLLTSHREPYDAGIAGPVCDEHTDLTDDQFFQQILHMLSVKTVLNQIFPE
jgi:hypothetical protein